MADNTRILMISRKYPPSTGGMQEFAKDFIGRMEGVYDADKIVFGRGQINLIWFLPYSFVRSLMLIAAGKHDLVWLCDGLLAPMGVVLKKLCKIKVGITVHGLDITYSNALYQRVVPASIAALDRVVCVSENTLLECTKRGIPCNKCVVITNGIEEKKFKSDLTKGELLRSLELAFGKGLGTKKILITVGRVIRRKGVNWFIDNVMPRLSEDHIYLVAGEGPEMGPIVRKVKEKGIDNRVKMLGRISSAKLKILYNSAYAMVMPNQKISKDPEGFGIVAIEAASCGLPTVANSVDGLNDAVINGKTGWLVEYNNVDQFLDKINDISLHPDAVKKENRVFSWDNIIKKYQKVIDEL
ncbi:MAG: glycosyltransferase family 4 protein [Candidatus Omnitrophota bacterium]